MILRLKKRKENFDNFYKFKRLKFCSFSEKELIRRPPLHPSDRNPRAIAMIQI